MTPDILGGDWVAHAIPLRPDEEGEVVATLVHRAGAPRARRAVLYVHGFVDYFFQTHLAAHWEGLGFDFYALDLRKYGRSLRPRQTPNFCTDLAVYDEELDAAAQIIRAGHGHDVLVLMGHSTGGLITSLWASRQRGKGTVQALVLNSPWFDLAGNWFLRGPMTAAIDRVGVLAPKLAINGLDKHYGRSLHRSTGGEWDYSLDWKPIDGFPVVLGWLRAIRRGHAELARGLAMDCPALVCCSALSGPNHRAHEAILRTDSVLDVGQIAGRAHLLGADVTIRRIADGIHDLALSPEPARGRFFAAVAEWVQARLPAAANGAA
ncbi:alpha/beta hydrolase [Phreatobacter sp.]|uniref:alpha/beta hydrolase n=1 Tax=Phreatobacter sp. TaxID=1966341 RepID=UPI0025CC490C|nr:alpha/beta hydrolase [Phreatobacter sp.]